MARSGAVHVPPLILLTAVASVAVLVVFATIFYWDARNPDSNVPGAGGPPYNGTSVLIQDYELIVSYWTNNTSDTHYLSAPGCPATFCPFYASPSASVVVNLSLADNDTVSHRILSIVLDPPFSVVGSTPAMPFTLAPHVVTYLLVTVQIPATPNAYDITGTINTS